jgi:DNA-binding response OmpR family regulator
MKSLLIIDGSEVIGRLFTDMFENRGWSVSVCADQRAALTRLAGDGRCDVVVLGYHLAGASQPGLVKFIRSLDHRKTTAVVLVAVDEEGRDAGLAAGADEALTKPVNPNALVWAVDKHLT